MSEAPPPLHGDEWRRGWVVVAASGAMAGTGSGLYQNLSSLFIPGLIEATGATRGALAAAAAFGLLGALAAPLIGRIVDRIGAVPVIVASALTLGATYLWLSMLGGALWHFQLGIALMAICTPGMSALIYGRFIARRFDAHRGLAMGLATSGVALTTIVVPPLLGWIIAEWGWRAGYYLFAALAVGVGLPMGLLAARGGGEVERSAPGAHRGTPPRWTDGRFVRIAGATMLINIGTVGLVTQLALVGRERGLGLVEAGFLVSAYGASQIVGRLAMGALIDRFPVPRVAAGFGMASAAGFIALLAGANGFVALTAAVFVAGLLNGAEYDLLPYLTSRLFPLEAYSEVFGRLLLCSILSVGMGLASFGLIHDWTGSYSTALGLGAVTMILATALLASLRVPPPPGAASAKPTR